MPHTFTRPELYALVWTEPLTTVAKRFGISSTAVAKRCRNASIPLPGLGYWAKKEYGKRVIQPKLPPRGLGQHETITFGPEERKSYEEQDAELLRTTPAPPPAFPDGLPEVAERARQIAERVIRVPTLSRPHHFIAKLLQEDEERRAKQAASKYPSFYDAPLFDAPFERRRLRIINALFLALARAGAAVSSPNRDAARLGVIVGDERVVFAVGPVKERPENQYPRVPPAPDEKMKVSLSWYQPPPEITTRWEDDARGKLETKLGEIVVGLLVAGEWGYRWSLERSYRYKLERKRELEAAIRRKEEEARRKERARIEKLAAERRDRLLGEARAWREASDIRDYVRAQLDHRLPDADARMRAECEAWAKWALEIADRLDPMKRATLRPEE